MNNRYRHKAGFYLILSRTFTKRDKYACLAFDDDTGRYERDDYRIYYKNDKRKRMVVFKVREKYLDLGFLGSFRNKRKHKYE